jgi:hypothetical protein
MALLRWIRRVVLLIVCVVVLREGSSSLATTRDEPAVVGEWLKSFAYAALSVEVGAEEEYGDGDED